MTVKRLALLVLAAGGGLCAAGRPAAAHPEAAPAGVSRYVTATVVGGRIEIADTWLLGTLPALEERRRLDSDGDGVISGAEEARGRAAAAAEPPTLAVTLDGQEQRAPAAVVIDLGGEKGARDAPLVIERRTTLLVGARPPRQLRLAVLREPARLMETEVAVELEPGLALAGAPDRVRWQGPRASAMEERSVTFVIAGPSGRSAWSIVGVFAVAAAGFTVLVARARARVRRRARLT